MIVDRTEWGRLRVTGGDRVRFLQGLTTVNVEQLADGAHAWGAILNPKGRVLSVIDIARLGDSFVISCEATLAEPTRTILDRYAVMDDVVFEPITGPAHQAWTDVASVWAAPIVEGAGTDPIADTNPAVERLRIRAGFLRYGADVDDDHFPFETPLVKFLDYGKGCYVGQEPVFRVHAQGNAARALRGFTIEGDAPIVVGTAIDHAAKSNAGKITSSITDVVGVPGTDVVGVGTDVVGVPGTDAGSIIALGYLHRTAWDAGGSVTIAGRTATVFELPMEPR